MVLNVLKVDIKTIKSNNLVIKVETLLNIISSTPRNNWKKV